MRGIRRLLRNWLGINRDLEATLREHQEIVWQLDTLDGDIDTLGARIDDCSALHKTVLAEKANREHLVERMQQVESAVWMPMGLDKARVAKGRADDVLVGILHDQVRDLEAVVGSLRAKIDG